jgi:glycosyltransferase involved in cell wall biosynthesis
MPRLHKIVRSLDTDVQSKIFMPGFIADDLLDNLYQQCFLFAMPSRAEGFGLVYLEAMSYGKLCIGGNMDAAQHVIRHNQTGRIVDPTSAQEIAVNIIHLLEHPDLVREMGNSSRRLVAEQYLFKHFKQRFLTSIGIV